MLSKPVAVNIEESACHRLSAPSSLDFSYKKNPATSIAGFLIFKPKDYL